MVVLARLVAAVAVNAAVSAARALPDVSSSLATRQTGGQFVPKPGYYPATGDDTIAGGIFCISLSDLAAYLARTGNNPGATGTESPRLGGGAGSASGTGPYPARATTDPALPNHTIFAPRDLPPANMTLPFIAWGNGGCATDPSAHKNFLIEVASHGYVIAADGLAGGVAGKSQSMVTDMRASLDWAAKGGAARYGSTAAAFQNGAVATMGHSCGGLEAMSTAYHDDRVKRIILLNIGIFQDEKRYLLQEIKVPVAWFVGGPKDMGYPNAEKDYKLLPTELPAFKASLDTGHGSTFAAPNGGKAARAVVNYLEWQFRNDTASRARLLDPKASGSLVSENWAVEYKNWT
ncbi:Chlorophyllase [Madurella fahalii]|uniref:Chlorophyllase n=1 Tax=Madurella fahalii TaxID=1157608 RepID=A0ABQ0GHB6_9PEZI